MVHAPRTPLTPKGLQRGKQGDVLRAGDAALMGPAVVNATLRRGDALYVPRAFFHHTSTSVGDGGGDGEPSAALTFSILSEDVYATWLVLLGEAVETLPGGARAARALQRQAAAQPGGAIGVRLREAPRGSCSRRRRPAPPSRATAARRGRGGGATLALLADALKVDGGGPAEWGDAALLDALDAALARKRIPRALKLAQIDAFLSAMEARDRGGGGLLGGGVLDVDIDAIFKIEKADKSWMPAQRAWYNAREWA